LVDVVLVPVALVQTRFVKEDGAEPRMVKLETASWVKVALDASSWVNDALPAESTFVAMVEAVNEEPDAVLKPNHPVEVPFTKLTSPIDAEPKLADVEETARKAAVFAKRFVVVTEVEVTSARTAFQRSEAEPSERAASSVGMREVETPPSTARPVVVTLEPWAFVKVRPWREAEPSTVSVEETETVLPNTNAPVDVPPLNTKALVVVFPALVTVWRLETVPVGQFVPSAKHGSFPFTYSCDVEAMPETVTLVAATFVPVAFVKVAAWSDVVPVAVRLPTVAELIWPLAAWKLWA
jgi:hypothetical protein